ncbi:MAG: exodeoxyribonuclease VII small subunit [Deltaproteobacteria bacterium]|nr:exodeoxyribonuclease VII small subunit [Deltaproteobacteria bacterium]
MPDEATPTPTPATPEEQRFEDLLKDLTAVVERLERGNLTLDESVAQYARGTELLKVAQRVLDGAQARLDVLMGCAPGATPKLETADPEEFLK